MDESQSTSKRSLSDGTSTAEVAESLAKEVISKGVAMGSDPKEIAELYAAAFIAVAISSASALAARDVERCISTLNTTMRLAAALGFRFGIGAVEPSPIEMPGEARRDH